MEMPFGGTQASDTFETGTRAAACGGTTRGDTIADGCERHHAKKTRRHWAARITPDGAFPVTALIIEAQREGKRPMPAAEVLRGLTLTRLS